ncbi:MAG: AmmeMemoRadiSam system protein B, partial [Bacillota bacterium]
EESANGSLQPLLLADKDPALQGGGSLDHGAMVPLYYLQQAGLEVPGVHITYSFHPLEQIYNFGRSLKRAVEKRGKKVTVLASGDLSHRLTRSAPAGYNPRGAEFDRQLVEYIRNGEVEKILNFDQQLVEQAGECGLKSFVMALGMLNGEKFNSEIISYEGPFGVGYLVAALRPAS